MIEQKYEKNIERLKKIITFQCEDGNWDYDPYMHGIANGLILALCVIEDKEGAFLNPPERWLKDILPMQVDEDIESSISEWWPGLLFKKE